MKLQSQSKKESAAVESFFEECTREIVQQGQNDGLQALSQEWIKKANVARYSYHFSWLGRPIIQYPQDIVAMQELVSAVQPDCIIETGIAHGGSLIFYASLLELNALCGGPEHARVVGVDIDIRQHNRQAVEAHPIYKRGRIHMVQGSSIAPEVLQQVHELVAPCKKIMVVLDSNHTHEHVLAEMEAYAPLVAVGSYCVVFDTIIEYMDENAFPDRPWGRGNNPMTAVNTFLATHRDFEIDAMMDAKLLISVAPRGYLRRTSIESTE